MTSRLPRRPLSAGASTSSCAAAGRVANKLIPAAAAAVAVEAVRKSRRPSCDPAWSCGFPSSHSLHISFPPLGLSWQPGFPVGLRFAVEIVVHYRAVDDGKHGIDVLDAFLFHAEVVLAQQDHTGQLSLL